MCGGGWLFQWSWQIAVIKVACGHFQYGNLDLMDEKRSNCITRNAYRVPPNSTTQRKTTNYNNEIRPRIKQICQKLPTAGILNPLNRTTNRQR